MADRMPRGPDGDTMGTEVLILISLEAETES